jgi:hypothetical protein
MLCRKDTINIQIHKNILFLLFDAGFVLRRKPETIICIRLHYYPGKDALFLSPKETPRPTPVGRTSHPCGTHVPPTWDARPTWVGREVSRYKSNSFPLQRS